MLMWRWSWIGFRFKIIVCALQEEKKCTYENANPVPFTGVSKISLHICVQSLTLDQQQISTARLNLFEILERFLIYNKKPLICMKWTYFK